MGDGAASHDAPRQLGCHRSVEPPLRMSLRGAPCITFKNRFALRAFAPLALTGWALPAPELEAGVRPL